MQRRSKFIWLGLLAFAAVLAARAMTSSKPTEAGALPNKSETAVTLTPVREQHWPVELSASGAIAPWQEAIIGARLSGIALQQVHVNVGDRVKRGEVLAEFDERSVLAELNKAKASLQQADALQKQATRDRDRAVTLAQSKLISEQDLLRAETQAETAAAQQALAQANWQAAYVRWQDLKVTAPDDGVISARSASLGQSPNVGTELFRLIRQERLEWRAELSPQQLTQIAIGMSVNISLADGSVERGKVRQIAAALENSNRLGLVYVDLIKPARAKAGMFVNGHFLLSNSPALTVPVQSLVVRDGKNSIFVVHQNKVRELHVGAGRRVAQEVEIIGDIGVDRMVVAQGAGFLSDGETVRVLTGPSDAVRP